MSDGLVLALDGATATCSVALLASGDDSPSGAPAVLARRSEVNGRGQAKILLRMVDEMLQEAGATPVDLERVVVGTGPGTFTGVRVTVATARGLSVGLGIPVFGVSTLLPLAACAVDSDEATGHPLGSTLVPVIDARRGQVFFVVYELAAGARSGGSVPWVPRGPIGVCDRGSLGEALAEVKRPVTVVGEHVGLAEGLPSQMEFVGCGVKAEYLVTGAQWIAEPRSVSEPSSGASGTLDGSDDHTSPGSPETVRPIYVRAPDADVHIKKMKDPWADANFKR